MYEPPAFVISLCSMKSFRNTLFCVSQEDILQNIFQLAESFDEYNLLR